MERVLGAKRATHRCHVGAVVYSTTRRLVGVARRCSSSSHHHHHHHHRITLSSSSSSRVAAVSRRPCVCTGWTSWSASWSVLSGSAIVDRARCSSTSRPPISCAAEKAYVRRALAAECLSQLQRSSTFQFQLSDPRCRHLGIAISRDDAERVAQSQRSSAILDFFN